MTLRTRSVGKRSMSTERGLRRSVLTASSSFGEPEIAGVVIQRHNVIGEEVETGYPGDFGADSLRDLLQVDGNHLIERLDVLRRLERAVRNLQHDTFESSH